MVALLKPKTFRDEPSVNEKYLQHSQHLDDYIISMRNGDLLAFFKVDGRTHDCASDRELITWNDDLNTLIKSFGTDHVEVWSHSIITSLKSILILSLLNSSHATG
ncbi:hypothetical protein [Klebsiella pneumoniae]|uniref:hypothetical protein n=1 Tax=Klebsiella pneumoniae TaxID=573 RepID=UPI00388F9294